MSELSVNIVGSQQLSVAGTAVALTVPSGKTPRHALIYVGTNSIRWLGGGTDPTASLGILVAAGGYIDWTEPVSDFRGLMTQAKFIQVTGAATLDIIYFT